MQKKDIIKKTFEIARPAVESRGLYIWDVDFEKEGSDYVLTVYVDSPGGVSIDDCEAISREIDPILDREDYIDISYSFCVSSAGLERVLKRDEHFEYALGKKIDLGFFSPVDGAKSITGELLSFDKSSITVAVAGVKKTFDKSAISLCRLHFEM